MIERLINLEHPYKGPGYSSQQEHIRQLLAQGLSAQLHEDGKAKLNQLTDAYMRQETLVLKDAFLDGFCAAVELVIMDCARHQN